MDSNDIKKRALFLLREAGPHKACVLAEVIGVTTCDMQRALTELRVDGKVEKLQVTSSEEKWFILRSSSEPYAPEL